MDSNNLTYLSLLSGRSMLAVMFIMAGFSKIGSYAGTQTYMESSGLQARRLEA